MRSVYKDAKILKEKIEKKLKNKVNGNGKFV